MTARYCRKLSDRFQDILMGPLAPFLEYRSGDDGKDHFLYDYHCRERDQFMVYCGTSRVVVCGYIPQTNKLRIHAAPTYSSVTKDLMNDWDCSDDAAMHDLGILLQEHLKRVDKYVPDAYYRNKREGYWQNKICVDLGMLWDSKDDWLIIDREVVVGFANKEARNAVLAPIAKPYENAVWELRKENSKKWGKPGKKRFGGELDILAIDGRGDIVCVELKHGRNAAGIYWGMYQTAVYHGLAKAVSETLAASVASLARQKIEMGLLPSSAENRLQLLENKQSSIRTVLAIAEPNWRSSCWKRLREVVARRPESETTVALFESGEEVSGPPEKTFMAEVSLSELPPTD